MSSIETNTADVITTDEQAEKIAVVLPKIEQLAQELQSENPEIDKYMKFINDDLRQYPELVHLLSDEQIKPLYSAMRQKTDITISVKASRGGKKKTKGLLDNGKMLGDLL